MAKAKTTIIEEDIPDDEPEGQTGVRSRRTIPFDKATLPPGVKAVLKLKPWRDVEHYEVYIYRRELDKEKPGKVKAVAVAKLYNVDVDEGYLLENYRKPYEQAFRVMFRIPDKETSGDVNVYTEDITIGGFENAAPAMVAPGLAAAPMSAPAGMGDPLDQMEKLARIMVTLRDGQAAPPAMPAFMERMFEAKYKHLTELEEKLERKAIGAPAVTVSKNESSPWPDLLKPFIPQLQSFGIQTFQVLTEKLLGGDIASKLIRAFIVNNETFKAMWGDVDKRNAAVQSMIGILGEETTEKIVRALAAAMGQP